MGLLSLTLVLLQAQAPPTSLSARIEARIAQAPARGVGVYYRDLTTRDSFTVGAFYAVPRGEHDEDPGHDSAIPRPGRRAPVARRLNHHHEHVSIDCRQLALPARRHRRLRLVAVRAPWPARADSRADRADGNGVEQPRHESVDHQG